MNSPIGLVLEVVRDAGQYEARNERVVVLKVLGAMTTEEFPFIYAYASGWLGTFKPGDRYELVKRPEPTAKPWPEPGIGEDQRGG